MFERFTPAARGVVVGAQQQARALRHTEILAEHLLLAVLADETSAGAAVLTELGAGREELVRELTALGGADEQALREIGVDLVAVRERAEAAFGPGALERPRPERAGLRRRMAWLGADHLRFADAAKRGLEQSLHQALALGSRSLTTDHILLGLLADDREPAAHALVRLGVDPGTVRSRVREHLQRAA